MSQFTDDLAIGRRAELIVKDVFSKLYEQCEFIDVAANKDFYYILASLTEGKRLFVLECSENFIKN